MVATVVAVNDDENNTSLNTNTALATNNVCNPVIQQISLNKQQQKLPCTMRK